MFENEIIGGKVGNAQTNKKKFEYYNTGMETSFKYPNQGDYFNQIFREHFIQSFHALGFCKMLKTVDP